MWKLFLSSRSRGLSTGVDGIFGVVLFVCRASSTSCPLGSGGGLVGLGGSVDDVAGPVVVLL
eukprot:1254694-Amphidinium_carterae.2